MRIRRCAIVVLEPREEPRLDLGSLFAGGAGISRECRWLALAAHLDAPVALDAPAREALGRLPVEQWVRRDQLPLADEVLEILLESGLAFAEEDQGERRRQDEAVRAAHWWPLSALAHRHGRWHGLDSVAAMDAGGLRDVAGLRARLGPAPPTVVEKSPRGARLPLPLAVDDRLDQHWMDRCTCRNFDTARPLPAAMLARMLQRVVMAKSVFEQDDMGFLKKNVASGGGLHPIESYLLLRDVEGIAPGLYHYHAVEHALEPLPAPAGPLPGLATRLLAGQYWFADAPVLLLLAARFPRSFWKYRRHPKGYRALVLEAGHISQACYLSAHELGLGAFVTAAFNEIDAEAAFGLDPAAEGPLAICGFGWRAPTLRTAEFDPGERVWARIPQA